MLFVGTLARFYQLKGNESEALKYAKEIIDATEIFQLLKRDDIMDSRGPNLMFERELIWALHDEKIESKVGYQLYFVYKYNIDLPSREFIYEKNGYGSVEDYRRVYWWQEVKLSTTFWVPVNMLVLMKIIPQDLLLQEMILPCGKNYYL